METHDLQKQLDQAITILSQVARETYLIEGDGESALSCHDEEYPTDLAIQAQKFLESIGK
jgi:hypothetical protein